jgi:hypothetical protein
VAITATLAVSRIVGKRDCHVKARVRLFLAYLLLDALELHSAKDYTAILCRQSRCRLLTSDSAVKICRIVPS